MRPRARRSCQASRRRVSKKSSGKPSAPKASIRTDMEPICQWPTPTRSPAPVTTRTRSPSSSPSGSCWMAPENTHGWWRSRLSSLPRRSFIVLISLVSIVLSSRLGRTHQGASLHCRVHAAVRTYLKRRTMSMPLAYRSSRSSRIMPVYWAYSMNFSPGLRRKMTS